MTGLDFGDGLTLPEDAITQTLAILGKKGSGKTSTGVVLALIAFGLACTVIPVVVQLAK